MIVKLLTEHHLKFLSLKGGYTGSSESTLVKMPHCWKSRATAHYYFHDLPLLLCDRPGFYSDVVVAARATCSSAHGTDWNCLHSTAIATG